MHRHVSQTFTSEMEEYKWIPQSTLFSESCSWQCVIPLCRGTSAGLTILSIYHPPSLCGAPQPIRPPELSQKRLTSSSNGTSSRTAPTETFSTSQPSRRNNRNSVSRPKMIMQPAVLEVYPEVNARPHLRSIIVLTAILVVVQKDEWKQLPYSWTSMTTADAVLSRLLRIYDPRRASHK